MNKPECANLLNIFWLLAILVLNLYVRSQLSFFFPWCMFLGRTRWIFCTLRHCFLQLGQAYYGLRKNQCNYNTGTVIHTHVDKYTYLFQCKLLCFILTSLPCQPPINNMKNSSVLSSTTSAYIFCDQDNKQTFLSKWDKYTLWDCGSHGSEEVDVGLLGCNTMWTCRHIPIF
jgi:hypothetical protein